MQFAFTITFHYLFPQLTMGLTFLIFILASVGLRAEKARSAHYRNCIHFLTKLLVIAFTAGVVTGIPMEFQFGTNWASFSAYSGSLIGQTLTLEGVLAFFTESIFLGLLLFQRGVSPRRRWVYTLAVFAGSWVSGFFIIATNAWMQHPVGYAAGPGGGVQLSSLGAMLTNPWLWWQFPHTMVGAVITGSFVVMGVGAFYLLTGRHLEYGRRFVQVGVVTGFIASLLQLYPLGDGQGRNVARYQPVTLAAMEGAFKTQPAAPIAIMGQPNMQTHELMNPIQIPKVLSFLTYRRWNAVIDGLESYPEQLWPDKVPLLYYSYHIMVGLGSIFIGVMLLAIYALWWDLLYILRPLLWMLLILSPFPFLANTAGWLTAELGRQPWVIYGLLRTSQGASPHVSAGNVVFTLVGFMGAYLLIGLLVSFLAGYQIVRGPDPAERDIYEAV